MELKQAVAILKGREKDIPFHTVPIYRALIGLAEGQVDAVLDVDKLHDGIDPLDSSLGNLEAMAATQCALEAAGRQISKVLHEVDIFIAMLDDTREDLVAGHIQ